MRLTPGAWFTGILLMLLTLVTVGCTQNENVVPGTPSAIPPASSTSQQYQPGTLTPATAANSGLVGVITTSSLPPAPGTPGGNNSFTPAPATTGPGPIKLKEISQALKAITDIPLPGSTARLDYQSLDLAKGLLFIAHLGDSSLIVVDLKANKVITEIKGLGGIHGVLVVPELGRVFATATSDHQVAVIDETSFNINARIPAGNYPDGLAYDPVNHKLYVSDEGGNSEAVIDVQNNKALPSIPLDGEGGNTQYDPVSTHIFINVQTRNVLAEIDPKMDKVIARYPLPGCQNNHGLQLDPDQRLAFVGCDGNAVLLELDMQQGMKVITQQNLGQSPDVMALDNENGWLYVACESGNVSVFNVKPPAVQKLAEGFLANGAHTVTVDTNSHRLYFPLNDVNGKPVLRVMEPVLSVVDSRKIEGENYLWLEP